MKYHLLLGLLALFLLNGCSTLLSTGVVQSPEISVRYLKPAGQVSPKGIPQHFSLGLAVHNPNAFAIPIKNFAYQFFLGDMLLIEGKSSNLPNFAANSTTHIEVSSRVGLVDAFKLATFFLTHNTQSFDYSLVTDITPSGFLQQPLTKTYTGDVKNPFTSP